MATAGVVALLTVLGALATVAALVAAVAHGEVSLLDVVAVPSSMLFSLWLVLGCWRRTWWGQPSEEEIAEANRPLAVHQAQMLTLLFPLLAMTAVSALVVALLLQLLWTD